MTSKVDKRWQDLFTAAMSEVAEWRGQHKKASFTEIEAALDKQLSGVRAQLLKDLVESSPRADLRGQPKEERPRCPECGEPLVANGQHTRKVMTTYEQQVELRRSYGRCPACGCGFFPSG
ncbi:MAG: hypothetical protein JXM69_02150 [Anaerolineae bacterium]|jgi:hypothetical protein|nr:hypothetical protein [Anaerolineae bacterium]